MMIGAETCPYGPASLMSKSDCYESLNRILESDSRPEIRRFLL
jgi:hypothetical protein